MKGRNYVSTKQTNSPAGPKRHPCSLPQAEQASTVQGETLELVGERAFDLLLFHVPEFSNL